MPAFRRHTGRPHGRVASTVCRATGWASAAFLASFLAGCGGGSPDTAAPADHTPAAISIPIVPAAAPPAVLTLLDQRQVELELLGDDARNGTAAAIWTDPDARTRTLSAGTRAGARATESLGGGLDLKSVLTATIDTGGYRYISATFLVRNAQACATPGTCTPYTVARRNVTMLPVIGTSVPGTPFGRFLRQDRQPADPTIATQLLPANALRTLPAGPTVDAQQASLQLFREAELPTGSTYDVLPYGFVVTNIHDGSRTLPANPAPNQFDGWVTIAYRVPLQSDPTLNPFTVSVRLLMAEDANTRVSQSLEESDAAVVARAAALGAADIAVPCQTPTRIAGANPICGVRVAGTALEPLTTLDGVTAGTTPNTLVSPPVTLPALAADDTVQWPVPVEASPLTMRVRPFATLPALGNGAPPRLSTLAHWDNRIFVGDEVEGRIYEITGGTVRLWFDVAAAVQASTGRRLDSTSGNPHSGLRSLAFHPRFATNGRFYTSLMEERPASPAGHRYLSDAPAPIGTDSLLVEWTADPATMTPTPTSYREVFRVGLPAYEHPIKQILFRPGARAADADFGLLYVAHGDGGAADGGPGNGMGNDARGKILRIDPLAAGAAPYAVPASNPFVGSSSGMPAEVWSLGHRNPHHLCITREGLLLAAEDGRDNIDEVNLVKPGANHGWPAREGTLVQLSWGTLVDGVSALPVDDATYGYTYPAAQFLHQGRRGTWYTTQALAGGCVVENGSGLHGHYFATDFVLSGDVFTATLQALKTAVTQGPPSTLRTAPLRKVPLLFDHDNDASTPAVSLSNLRELTRMAPAYDGSGRVDIWFGQGPLGELYLLSKRDRRVYLVTNSVP